MLQLSTEEVKAFASKASSIKSNTTLHPILSYILLRNDSKKNECQLIKNSMKAFIINTVESIGDSTEVLIDEKILFTFASNTNSPTILIDKKENRILISDGLTKQYSPTDDVKKYPLNNTPTSDWVKLPKGFILNINIATQMLGDDGESPDLRSSVFVGGGLIAGTDGTIGYAVKGDSLASIPKIVLGRSTALAISKLDDNNLQFSENDSYIFFKAFRILYGFIKPEAPWVDMTPFTVIPNEKENFFVDKWQLTQFCKLCIGSTNSKVLAATFLAEGKSLKLEMADQDKEINITRDIKIFDGSGSFKFNPIYMDRLLNAFPGDSLYFWDGGNKYYITDSSNAFIFLIMKIS